MNVFMCMIIIQVREMFEKSSVALLLLLTPDCDACLTALVHVRKLSLALNELNDQTLHKVSIMASNSSELATYFFMNEFPAIIIFSPRGRHLYKGHIETMHMYNYLQRLADYVCIVHSTILTPNTVNCIHTGFIKHYLYVANISVFHFDK